MIYITVKQSPQYHQMTLDELLFGTFDPKKYTPINADLTDTRTYLREEVNDHFLNAVNIPKLIEKLETFNKSTEALYNKPRSECYSSFHIPKKSGGLRKIDAPNDELKDALYCLKHIFEDDFHALYHTSAFAYIRKRSTIECIKRHQMNESRWFLKTDLSNFFGSTTLEFVMKMFSMIFPFSEVIKYERGRNALKTALSLAFLDGGLPQGTPISPLITNIMMIPIDFALANALRDFEITDRSGNKIKQRFIYTRYADDFQISSKYDFDFRAVESFVVQTLEQFEAPFKLNQSKTRYGSSAGQNWNLGVMLNKDNNITVGSEKKRQFKAMLTNFILDTKKGVHWSFEDVNVLSGYRNYYRMVERDTIDEITNRIGKKFGVDVEELIHNELIRVAKTRIA